MNNSGQRRNITTIEQMEAEAKECNGDCNKRVNGEWLEVSYLSVKGEETYLYKLGRKRITREAACILLAHGTPL